MRRPNLHSKLASELARAFSGPNAADELLAKADMRTFASITMPSPARTHIQRMREVVSYAAETWELGFLIDAARILRMHRKSLLIVLDEAAEAVRQERAEANWKLLCAKELVLEDGPFVNRGNLRNILNSMQLVSRRVLCISGGPSVLGKSWSRKLIESGDRFDEPPLVIDLRAETDPQARASPSWILSQMCGLLPRNRRAASAAMQAENRLVEWLTQRWLTPLDPRRCVVIDHACNASRAVQEYVAALAYAVAEGKLKGLWLVLIDPPSLDLSDYAEYVIEDVVDALPPEKIRESLTEAEQLVCEPNGRYAAVLSEQVLAGISWPLTRD